MDETITYACIDVMPSGRNIAPLVDTVVNLLEYGNFLFALVTNAARVEDFFRKLSEGNSMGRCGSSALRTVDMQLTFISFALLLRNSEWVGKQKTI